MANGPRHIGGAVGILRPRIDEKKRIAIEHAVRFRRRAIMHDRAMGSGARDGLETEIANQPVLAPESFQPAGRFQFRNRLRRRQIEPGEKPRQRHSVADMGLTSPGDLGRVLAGFGQLAGIIALADFRPRRLQPAKDPDRRARRIDAHAPAGQIVEGRTESVRRIEPHVGIKALPGAIGDLARVHEQLGAAIVTQHRETQRQR